MHVARLVTLPAQIPLYYNRQASSANRNAVSCGTSRQGVLLPVSEMSQCTGSKYPAEIQPLPTSNNILRSQYILYVVRSVNVP